MKYNILVLTTAVLLAGCGSSESTRPLQIAVTVDGAGNVIPENSEGTETPVTPQAPTNPQTPTTPQTPTAPQIPTTPTPIAGECVDTPPLNDGFGWNGVESCTLDVVSVDVPRQEELPPPPPETMPMDIDWSWAVDQWMGCRVTENDTGNRWAWKLNADGLMVDQFNTVFGAWSLTEYTGDRAVLLLDQGGRQDATDIWIDENSVRLHSVGSANAWGICSNITDPVAWLSAVEPGVVNNRPHSRFDNTQWYCSIRVGPTWVEGYTIELHRNGDVIGYEQRFDSLWRPFGTRGNPRYFTTWDATNNDTQVLSLEYGLLTWDRNNNTLQSLSLIHI